LIFHHEEDVLHVRGVHQLAEEQGREVKGLGFRV
jgi:hypothetical protein